MTGYTRADSVNNIADGNIINASDLDGEFDAVQAAFNSTTGHVHDGTAANGAPITKIGPTQDVVASAIALLPKTTATVDVGSSSLKFKDFFFSGAGSVTGTITAGGFSGTVGATTPAAGTFTSLSDSGNLTFTGTGNRITGDFSNATVSNRVTFQTSTSNSNTSIGVIPNGTATGTNFSAFAGTDSSNSSFMRIRTDGTLSYLESDSNGTGTYLPMTFYTGGSERMRLDTSGNVGIGTSAPGQLLDVNGNIQVRSGNKIGFFDQTYFIRASTGLEAQSADFIRFLTNGANERMRIDSSGNVGIGTGSPVYRLSVVGPNNTGIASFSGNNNGVIPGSDGDATLVIGGNYAAGSAEVDYFHNNSTYKGTIGGHRFLQRTGASTTRDLMWLTENQTTFYTAGTERMRIDSSGNVGIGTSSPTQKLDVNGIGRMRFSSGTGAGHYLDTTGNASRFFVGTDAVTEAWRVYDSIGVANRIYLDSSGNVGIGTSSPVAKLDVNNAVVARPSTTAQSGELIAAASDYASLPSYTNTALRQYGSTTAGTFYGLTKANLGVLEFVNGSAALIATNGSTPIVFTTTSVERMRIDSSGNVLVTNPAGLGYGTGSGGTVTQATSRTTAVTINKPTGQITMFTAAGSATPASFTVNNSLVALTDTVVLSIASGASNYYILMVGNIAAGSFNINFWTSGGTASDTLKINFAIIKGASS